MVIIKKQVVIINIKNVGLIHAGREKFQFQYFKKEKVLILTTPLVAFLVVARRIKEILAQKQKLKDQQCSFKFFIHILFTTNKIIREFLLIYQISQHNSIKARIEKKIIKHPLLLDGFLAPLIRKMINNIQKKVS